MQRCRASILAVWVLGTLLSLSPTDAPASHRAAPPTGGSLALPLPAAPSGALECAAPNGVTDEPQGDERPAPNGLIDERQADDRTAPKGRHKTAQGGAPPQRRGALGSPDPHVFGSPERATHTPQTVSRPTLRYAYDLVYVSHEYLYDDRGVPRTEHFEGGEFQHDGERTRGWRVIFHYDRNADGLPTRILVIYEYDDALPKMRANPTDASARVVALLVAVVGHYDPSGGRFLQDDPILGNRASQGYGYGGNSPTNNTDPMGTDVLVSDGLQLTEIETMFGEDNLDVSDWGSSTGLKCVRIKEGHAAAARQSFLGYHDPHLEGGPDFLSSFIEKSMLTESPWMLIHGHFYQDLMAAEAEGDKYGWDADSNGRAVLKPTSKTRDAVSVFDTIEAQKQGVDSDPLWQFKRWANPRTGQVGFTQSGDPYWVPDDYVASTPRTEVSPGPCGLAGAAATEARLAAGEEGASFGKALSNDYRATFFRAHPELEGKVVVHHAVEQGTMTRYPGLVSEAEMHSLENLRGIPSAVNSELHLSDIRVEWNRFYEECEERGVVPTQADLLRKATEIDAKYGSQFLPPVRR